MPENGAVSMAHRAVDKQTFAMVDWAESKGKTTLVIGMPDSIFQKWSWSENNYSYAIKTNIDNKRPLNM